MKKVLRSTIAALRRELRRRGIQPRGRTKAQVAEQLSAILEAEADTAAGQVSFRSTVVEQLSISGFSPALVRLDPSFSMRGFSNLA